MRQTRSEPVCLARAGPAHSVHECAAAHSGCQLASHVNLQVATTLLGLSVPTGSAAAHILAFIGGPCSEGSGKVVGRELSEEIRSHKVGEGGPVPISIQGCRYAHQCIICAGNWSFGQFRTVLADFAVELKNLYTWKTLFRPIWSVFDSLGRFSSQNGRCPAFPSKSDQSDAN